MSTRSAPAPGPWRLTLVANPDDCNLACGMCECGAARAAGAVRRPRRMDPELPRRVLDERRGSALREVIPSTMGEPLLWAGLDDLADLCAERGLLLNVTTNGTWPGRGARAWAERLVPVASDVKVSWNGATAATAAAVMPGIDLGEAIEGVRAFAAVRDARARGGARRCTLSLQVTAQETNVAEIPDIVRLASALGVDRVKLNHLQPRLPGLAARSLRRSAAAAARWNAAVREARRAAAEGGVRLQNAIELEPDPADGAPRGPCPFLDREAWVLVDGRFAPCPSPAAARGELGDIGSLAERTLAEVWASPAYRALVAGYETRPACRACAFRRPGGA